MKILALEVEAENTKPEQFTSHLKAEARHVWDLYQSSAIRGIYFRADRPDSMPLVQAGLIRFEVIPLVPYPGFARLFEE